MARIIVGLAIGLAVKRVLLISKYSSRSQIWLCLRKRLRLPCKLVQQCGSVNGLIIGKMFQFILLVLVSFNLPRLFLQYSPNPSLIQKNAVNAHSRTHTRP